MRATSLILLGCTLACHAAPAIEQEHREHQQHGHLRTIPVAPPPILGPGIVILNGKLKRDAWDDWSDGDDWDDWGGSYNGRTGWWGGNSGRIRTVGVGTVGLGEPQPDDGSSNLNKRDGDKVAAISISTNGDSPASQESSGSDEVDRGRMETTGHDELDQPKHHKGSNSNGHNHKTGKKHSGGSHSDGKGSSHGKKNGKSHKSNKGSKHEQEKHRPKSDQNERAAKTYGSDELTGGTNHPNKRSPMPEPVYRQNQHTGGISAYGNYPPPMGLGPVILDQHVKRDVSSLRPANGWKDYRAINTPMLTDDDFAHHGNHIRRRSSLQSSSGEDYLGISTEAQTLQRSASPALEKRRGPRQCWFCNPRAILSPVDDSDGFEQVYTGDDGEDSAALQKSYDEANYVNEQENGEYVDDGNILDTVLTKRWRPRRPGWGATGSSNSGWSPGREIANPSDSDSWKNNDNDSEGGNGNDGGDEADDSQDDDGGDDGDWESDSKRKTKRHAEARYRYPGHHDYNNSESEMIRSSEVNIEKRSNNQKHNTGSVRGSSNNALASDITDEILRELLGQVGSAKSTGTGNIQGSSRDKFKRNTNTAKRRHGHKDHKAGSAQDDMPTSSLYRTNNAPDLPAKQDKMQVVNQAASKGDFPTNSNMQSSERRWWNFDGYRSNMVSPGDSFGFKAKRSFHLPGRRGTVVPVPYSMAQQQAGPGHYGKRAELIPSGIEKIYSHQFSDMAASASNIATNFLDYSGPYRLVDNTADDPDEKDDNDSQANNETGGQEKSAAPNDNGNSEKEDQKSISHHNEDSSNDYKKSKRNKSKHGKRSLNQTGDLEKRDSRKTATSSFGGLRNNPVQAPPKPFWKREGAVHRRSLRGWKGGFDASKFHFILADPPPASTFGRGQNSGKNSQHRTTSGTSAPDRPGRTQSRGSRSGRTNSPRVTRNALADTGTSTTKSESERSQHQLSKDALVEKRDPRSSLKSGASWTEASSVHRVASAPPKNLKVVKVSPSYHDKFTKRSKSQQPWGSELYQDHLDDIQTGHKSDHKTHGSKVKRFSSPRPSKRPKKWRLQGHPVMSPMAAAAMPGEGFPGSNPSSSLIDSSPSMVKLRAAPYALDGGIDSTPQMASGNFAQSRE